MMYVSSNYITSLTGECISKKKERYRLLNQKEQNEQESPTVYKPDMIIHNKTYTIELRQENKFAELFFATLVFANLCIRCYAFRSIGTISANRPFFFYTSK